MKFSTPKDTVYKKKWLPKPVASDCRAPQASVKHGHSECTCVCPAVSRLWTSTEELKKKNSRFSNLRFWKKFIFQPTWKPSQVHGGEKPGILSGAVIVFSYILPFHLGSVCTVEPWSPLKWEWPIKTEPSPLKTSQGGWQDSMKCCSRTSTLWHFLHHWRKIQAGWFSLWEASLQFTYSLCQFKRIRRICDLLNIKYHHAIQKQI